MNYGKILSVGFKVLVAAVAGVAVFIGVDKINTNNGNQNGGFRQKSIPDDPSFSSGSEFQSNNNTQIQQVKRDRNDSNIVEKMKNVQDTCGRLFTFVQSLTMVVDNFSRIFRNDGNSYLSQSYYGDPCGGYRQPIDTGNGVYLNRISPYIIEASSTPDPRYYGRL